MPKIHIVQRGEYLSKIAKKYKISKWETIYHHPDNSEFRQKRPNPNVICFGDPLVIPDIELRYESGETEKRHKFRLQSPTLLLRIVVRDIEGIVLANEPYQLTVDDKEYHGNTDGQGFLEERIPVDASKGRLYLEKMNVILPLGIGQLDPTDNQDEPSKIVTGAQARLNNLGYYCGQVDDYEGPKTKNAIRHFQRVVMGREEPDGVLDKKTRDALIREHGC
ncbi:MAG: peptidoglycan-binding protein [Candidatus Competibacteraceae bacterium]|nr:peptidoglycan-binding protein [Candidatus Competibacteraceae bacterium]